MGDLMRRYPGRNIELQVDTNGHIWLSDRDGDQQPLTWNYGQQSDTVGLTADVVQDLGAEAYFAFVTDCAQAGKQVLCVVEPTRRSQLPWARFKREVASE